MQANVTTDRVAGPLLAWVRFFLVLIAGAATGLLAERRDPFLSRVDRDFDNGLLVFSIVIALAFLVVPSGRRRLIRPAGWWAGRVEQMRTRRGRKQIPAASNVGLGSMRFAFALFGVGVVTSLKLLGKGSDAGDVVFVGWAAWLGAAQLDVAWAKRRAAGEPLGSARGSVVLNAYAVAVLLAIALVPLGRYHIRIHKACVAAHSVDYCKAHPSRM